MAYFLGPIDNKLALVQVSAWCYQPTTCYAKVDQDPRCYLAYIRHNELKKMENTTLDNGSVIRETPVSGLILGLHPANEKQRYFVTLSLIGWAQT